MLMFLSILILSYRFFNNKYHFSILFLMTFLTDISNRFYINIFDSLHDNKLVCINSIEYFKYNITQTHHIKKKRQQVL
jgi:hypothetical protein